MNCKDKNNMASNFRSCTSAHIWEFCFCRRGLSPFKKFCWPVSEELHRQQSTTTTKREWRTERLVDHASVSLYLCVIFVISLLFPKVWNSTTENKPKKIIIILQTTTKNHFLVIKTQTYSRFSNSLAHTYKHNWLSLS